MNITIIPQNPKSHNLGRAAMAYASRFGWRVIPIHSIRDGGCTCQKSDCHSPGKHPLTLNGVKNASNDPAIIQSWWRRWPMANVGIATGVASGFFVLDVDGQQGAESREGLTDQQGKLPATVEALTGGGGQHILFQYPEKLQIGNKVAVALGLDVRGDGGYIVAAPSTHISGRQYEWEASSRPGEIKLAEAPGWLLSMLAKPEGQGLSRTIEDWRQLVNQGVPEGKRNASVASITGILLRRFIDPWIVLDLVLAWNKTKCQPPLSDDEVAVTVDSVAKLEARRREGGTHGAKRY